MLGRIVGCLALAATACAPSGPRGRPVASAAPAAASPVPDSSLESLLGDARLAVQVRAVIDSVDATGAPPAGVTQGGRRGGARGVFMNAEGRLPPEPHGYYLETDVWPRGRHGRGPERLIFGRGREVYYTGDHYRTFVRVR